jgi:predicted transcriptional regulator
MINKDKKLINTLKKFYEDKEFSTTFQDEVYSWNNDDYETTTEYWEIVYYLKLNQLLGEGSNSVASFDVIITDIIIDDEHNRLDVWADRDYDQYAWFIETVREDLYDTIGNAFPISLYFDFYTEEEYKNIDNQEEI